MKGSPSSPFPSVRAGWPSLPKVIIVIRNVFYIPLHSQSTCHFPSCEQVLKVWSCNRQTNKFMQTWIMAAVVEFRRHGWSERSHDRLINSGANPSIGSSLRVATLFSHKDWAPYTAAHTNSKVISPNKQCIKALLERNFTMFADLERKLGF